MSVINISKDFSRNPGARYYSDGDFSGQEFFETQLDKGFQDALKENEKLTINLDGTNGFASSFLSEAFGLLAEKYGMERTLENLNIISNEEPDWKVAILTDYIPNAAQRKKTIH